MIEAAPVTFKGQRLRALLDVYRHFRARCTEDPKVARHKREEYARKVWAGETVDIKDVKGVIKHLGIKDYAVIGGNAAILYGARRTTVDIDIIAPAKVVAELVKGRRPSPMTVGGFSIEVKGFTVDLLHWHDPPWLNELLLDAAVHDGIRVVSPPWLVVLKLTASRDIDVADIIAILRGMTPGQLKRTKALIKKRLPDEIEDFENLVELARLT